MIHPLPGDGVKVFQDLHPIAVFGPRYGSHNGARHPAEPSSKGHEVGEGRAGCALRTGPWGGTRRPERRTSDQARPMSAGHCGTFADHGCDRGTHLLGADRLEGHVPPESGGERRGQVGRPGDRWILPDGDHAGAVRALEQGGRDVGDVPVGAADGEHNAVRPGCTDGGEDVVREGLAVLLRACRRARTSPRSSASRQGGTSKVVDRIEAAGYRRRRPHPKARGSAVVELPPGGPDLLSRAVVTFETELRRQIGSAASGQSLAQFAPGSRIPGGSQIAPGMAPGTTQGPDPLSGSGP